MYWYFIKYFVFSVLINMGRTKVDIDISALGLRTKQLSLVIGSNTASSDIISKILEKLRMQDPPSTFQLFAMARDSKSESKFLVKWLREAI